MSVNILTKFITYYSNNSSGLCLILCLSTVSLDFVSDVNIIAFFCGYGNTQKQVIPMALNEFYSQEITGYI